MPKAQALEYEAQVPTFIQRMKQGHAALDGRHNVQIPRAHGTRGKQGRLNMAGEEGEDDPVMLDEDGNVVSKDDVEALKQGKTEYEAGSGTAASDQIEKTKPDEHDTQELKPEQNVSSGFGKKRKAAKIVGEHGENDDPNEDMAMKVPVKSLEDSTKDLKHIVVQNKENSRKQGVRKAKKNKVKLSFDEPE